MKTRKQILDVIKNGRKSKCIDSRDYYRLADFFPAEDLEILGFNLKENAEHIPKDLTQENILAQLKFDVSFGFEKALDKRGISSGLMYEVVKMWLWILDDELFDFDGYAMYGLPLFKAVALKYNFENPIDNDSGGEPKYAEY